jgi:3-oxoadipate CoA-transferase alpha subunit
MRDVTVTSHAEAILGLSDGASIFLGGFGGAGLPRGLIGAVLDAGIRDLTVIANNAGADGDDLTLWLEAGLVRKVICSYPRAAKAFDTLYRQGKVELELVPQGTLIERIRCAGAGLGGFYSPVGVGTLLGEGKEIKIIDGREFLLELPLPADFALLRGHKADPLGNVTYYKTGRNYSPMMATAASTVVIEVDELVELGGIDPEHVITPCIFVDRVVLRRGTR